MSGVVTQRLGGATPLSATISPPVTPFTGGSPPFLSANQITAIVVGGYAPYTYLWSSDGDATADSPAAAVTNFTSATGAPQLVQCQITDGSMAVVFTPTAQLG